MGEVLESRKARQQARPFQPSPEGETSPGGRQPGKSPHGDFFMDLPKDPPDWFAGALAKALTKLEYGQEKASAAPDLWNQIRAYLGNTAQAEQRTEPSAR